MVVGITENTNDNQIDTGELFAVVKAAATVPTCVQYKGRLGSMVICDVHFYGKMTNGCTVWLNEDEEIKFPHQKFRSWKEVKEFIDKLASQKPESH